MTDRHLSVTEPGTVDMHGDRFPVIDDDGRITTVFFARTATLDGDIIGRRGTWARHMFEIIDDGDGDDYDTWEYRQGPPIDDHTWINDGIVKPVTEALR